MSGFIGMASSHDTKGLHACFCKSLGVIVYKGNQEVAKQEWLRKRISFPSLCGSKFTHRELAHEGHLRKIAYKEPSKECSRMSYLLLKN